MADDKKRPQAAGDPGGKIALSDIADKLTINGRPVFDDIKIDPDTGDLLSYTLQPEIKARLLERTKEITAAAVDMANKSDVSTAIENMEKAKNSSLKYDKNDIKAAIKDITENLLTNDSMQLLQSIRDDLQQVQALLDELRELEPYLREELKKPQYEGKTFDNIVRDHTPAELLELLQDTNSYFLNAMIAARAARGTAIAKAFRMNQSKEMRQTQKDNAQSAGAIMNIRNNALVFFTDPIFQNAFKPENIDIMAGLETGDVEENTGKIKERAVQYKERTTPAAVQIPYNYLALCAAILNSTVDDKEKEDIPSNRVTFYVRGVLTQITDDPRILYGRQINLIDGKDPGEQYIESLIGSLVKYIGKIGNSRYSIIMFESYDAEADTITVRMPYLYEIMRRLQKDYQRRQGKLIAAEKDKTKLTKKEKSGLKTPVETNELFKVSAYTANPTTLQIAVQITNAMIKAGSGKDKTTEYKFTTLINDCPLLKEKLEELETLPRTEALEGGKIKNNMSTYNAELKKIKSAIDLILNPDKCKATERYKFIDIEPANNTFDKEGNLIKCNFAAPTKTKLDGKLIIKWESIKN